MENLYEVLEVSQNASKEVIEKAYKVLVKRYHPDVATDKELANKMMVKINQAYTILSDEKKRKDYDSILKCEEYSVSETKARQKQEIFKEQENALSSNRDKIFNKIKVNNKVLIGIIIVSIVLFIFLCASLWNILSNIMSDNTTVDNSYDQYIDDEELNIVIKDLEEAIKEIDINKIILNVVNDEYFVNSDIELIKENISMYNQILGDFEIIVTSAKVNENTAKIDVMIQRNNVEDIVVYYYLLSNYGLSDITKEYERNLFENTIKDNAKTIKIKDNFFAKKNNEQWKIEITNSNIVNILGMSVEKYEELFHRIY